MPLDMDKIEEMISKEVDPVYKTLAAKLREPESKHMPHILARVANPQQAQIMNMLGSPLGDIAAALGIDPEMVEKDLLILFERGLLHRGRSGWHLNRSWRAARDSVAGSNSKYDDDLFFDLVAHKELEDRTALVDQVEKGEVMKVSQGMRVIPRWASIKDIEGVLPCEDVREILKASKPIAILGCPCKKIERFRDCRDEVPLETCMVIGRSAQYNLERNAARELSVEEALAIIESLDAHQVVHMTGNTNIMPPLLCNCHACCCGALIRSALTHSRFNQFAIARSRFIAEEDPKTCNGCRNCADVRCPVGAIEMKYHPDFGEERATTNPENCIGCGLCVITCPTEARKMKLVRLPDHIPEPEGRSEEYATY
jgi:Na+-translocating ferredoxin:NAD+ oxidoreductase subunit B